MSRFEFIQPVRLKDGTEIIGPIEADFARLPTVAVTAGGRTVRIRGSSFGRAVGGDPPSMEMLEEWVNDSVCATPMGDTVEPDGYGPDSCPSWLLLLGMI